MSEPTHAHGAAHSHDHDDGRVHAHVSSLLGMIGIFGALIFLTFVTVAVSYVDLGSANTIVAVLVATIKASLVALFFMHLRHDKAFHGLIFVSGFVFLGIFLMLTLDDVSTRGRVEDAHGTTVLARTGEVAPGGMPEPTPSAHAGGNATGAGGGTQTHSVPSGPSPAHGGPAGGGGGAGVPAQTGPSQAGEH